MKRKVLLFILMTTCMTLFTYFISNLSLDEIWNYGFSYNIAKGAIPYRDFNIVVMPFYSLIMAIPLKIIGNNLFIFHLSNAILISSILTLIDDGKSLNSICICLYIMILYQVYGYNCFIMILLILVLYLENSKHKYKSEIIGLLLGCILATKQNIGAVLFIPYIINSKQKIKSVYFYLIPITLIIIYLILNNNLMECIDYCFLGLGNFKDNFYIASSILIIILLIIIIYLINKYRKTKDINYLYLLFFQIINYPLIELYHFLVGVIPIVYYLLIKENNKYINLVLYIFPIIFCLHSIITIKPVFSDINIYKYRNVGNNSDDRCKEIMSFINTNNDSKVFIFTGYSYFIKIGLNEKIDKYDLINIGNMGSKEEKYITDIEKMCKNKNCIFIMNKDQFNVYRSQLNPIIKDYVLTNYDYCGKVATNQSYYCKKK